MDLNHTALWLAGLFSASLFWSSLRAPHRPLGWLGVTALVMLVALVGESVLPERSGYVAGALALLLILLPMWIHGAASRASNRFLYRRARRLFGIAAALHPLDGWPAKPRLMEAFELSHAGRTGDSEALLQLLARGNGTVASTAQAHRLRILGQWHELKALAERGGLAALSRDPSLLVMYLRALGELGEVDHLAEFMRAQEQTLIGSGAFDAGLLYLFAFSGQVELTRQALAAAREPHTEETRQLWVALATERAGDVDPARHAFDRLRRAADPQIRGVAARHFQDLLNPPQVDPPTVRVLQVVAHFARLAGQRQNLIPGARGQRTERHVVVLLIVINAIVYLYGTAPGFLETSDTFVKQWSFNADRILNSGEWRRLLSYLFVHANWIHLLMNMLGLWALGPFVERAFGRLRFGLIYLAAGCTGSIVYLVLYQVSGRYSGHAPDDLVGASGCIMGLLGATAAVMLRAWVTQRAAIARQIFFRLLMVVALQVAFDLSTPQVAGLAHAVGLAGGFLTALALRERVSAKQSIASLA
jgi:rhomboid protease GluP